MSRFWACTASFLLGIAVCGSAFWFSGCGRRQVQPSEQSESRLERVKQTGVLRIGYGGYPPYLVKGGKPGEVSGLSVDLINLIVEIWNRGIKIEWVETSWDRVKADFLADKFDLVVEPLFRTIARASELDFTRPYTYSGYGVAVIRPGEKRFKSLDDFDKPEVTIVVNQSVSSHDFVVRRLPHATLRVLPTGNLDQPLTEVMLGQADAAFADVPSVTRFVEAHPGKVETLFYENPPVLVGAGFMLPQGDYRWAAFLNVAIDFLESTGEIRRLSQKYDVPYYQTSIVRSKPK